MSALARRVPCPVETTFKQRVTGLMCSERDQLDCHRHYTLGPILVAARYGISTPRSAFGSRRVNAVA